MRHADREVLVCRNDRLRERCGVRRIPTTVGFDQRREVGAGIEEESIHAASAQCGEIVLSDAVEGGRCHGDFRAKGRHRRSIALRTQPVSPRGWITRGLQNSCVAMHINAMMERVKAELGGFRTRMPLHYRYDESLRRRSEE